MSSEQFDSFAQLLPEPLLLVSSDGEVYSANKAAGDLVGIPKDQLHKRRLAELVEEPEDDVKRFLRSCARSRQMTPGRLTLPRSNGEVVDDQWEGTLLQPWSRDSPALVLLRQKHKKGSSGQFLLLTQKVNELTREIRARKEAERRLAFLSEADRKLAQSLDFEKTIQEVANLMVPDLADWFVATIFSPDKPAGEAFKEVIVTHKDPKKERVTRELRQKYPPDPWASQGSTFVIRTGESEFYPEITDQLLVDAAQDEEQLNLLREAGMESAMVVPMQAGGRTIGALSLVRGESFESYTRADLQFAEELGLRIGAHISNARLYKEAEEARRHAETMNRLKSAFLANMSHEIRTPLTGIIGLSSLLSRKIPNDQREFVERIEAGGHRLLETLNAVLSLARLEAQEEELKLEPRKVVTEVREVVQLFEQRANEEGLTMHLHVHPDAEDALARLDQGAFSSILHNLIGNAIKYTEKGGIEIRVMANRNNVNVEIEDTGIGIDEKVQPHIFDAFWQESKGWGRSHEGVGIGLSITKRLVDQLNGEIEASSTKGEGSTFTLRLPRALADNTFADPEKQDEPDRSLETQKRILVVEDNKDTRFFFETLLDDVGAVDVVNNAEGAFEQLRTVRNDNDHSEENPPYDVLVIDINLGSGLNGVELLNELRSDPIYKRVPMIAVTAYAMPGDRQRLLDAGFDGYLDKPFRAHQLLDIIADFLKNGRPNH